MTHHLDAFAAACIEAGGFPALPPPPAAGAPPVNAALQVHDGGLTPRPLLGLASVSAYRPIRPLPLASLTPGLADAPSPTFEWVSPTDLQVDESYQRAMSERSIALIRKIVTNWDWRRFKPPVVARIGDMLLVIDGQHTAIAAATHPEILQIPIMVVVAAERADQALAFVGHNRDRLGITPMQMHFAAVAAGDEDALTIEQVCERAGVTILRISPAGGVFKPRQTVAVNAIAAIINRRGAQKARVVLQVLAEAEAAPVTSVQIKAIEMLLHDQEYRGQVEPADLTAAIRAMGLAAAEQEAKVFAAAHNVPNWRALGVVVFRKARKVRRRSDA